MKNMQDTLQLVKEAQNVVKSRFLLSILVSQRIHQLEKGAQPTIENIDPNEYSNPKSYFELALKEICEGNMDLEQVTEDA